MNQDDAGIWVHKRDPKTGMASDYVLAVFDGHGRELGQLAAQVAKDAMQKMFLSSETWLEASK